MDFFAREGDFHFLRSESQKVFQNLIESVKSGVFMTDANGLLIFVNQAFVDILGFSSKEEAIGKNLADELFENSIDRDVYLKNLEKFGFVKDYEVRSSRREGTRIFLSLTSNYVRNERDEVSGTEGLIQDVSDKKKLEENLKIETTKLEQILKFNEEISGIHALDQLCQYIVDQTTRILGAAKCSLMLYDEGSRELKIQAAQGLRAEVIATTSIKLGDPIAGFVAKSGNPLLVRNIEADQEFRRKSKSHYGTRSFMCAPIKRDNKLIGVLNVSDRVSGDQEFFSVLDLKILCAIARQAGVSVENSRLYNELEYLSRTDPLTDLCNYRSFVKSLDDEIIRLKRYPGTLSLMMIDLDYFKAYNDTYGHPEGDNLLRRVSEIFIANLRGVDTICRYGGDEFVVILPGTDIQHAQMAAEKLRQRVEEIFKKEKVSLSIGIAEYSPHLSRMDLTLRADKALYEAKKQGRNRVSIYQ